MAIKKIIKKKAPKETIEDIVSQAHMLNAEIKELEKEYINDSKKKLDALKAKIKKHYEEKFKGKSSSVEKYEIQGSSGGVISLEESYKVDSRLFWDAIDEDIDVLLDLISVTKAQAQKILPGDTVEECMVKDEDKAPTIRFKDSFKKR